MLIQTEFGIFGSISVWISMTMSSFIGCGEPSQTFDFSGFCTNWLNQDSPIDSYWKWRTPYWNGWFVGANRWGVDVDTPFRGESALFLLTKIR